MKRPEYGSNYAEYVMNSAEGDRGLSDVRFVLHGNSSTKDSARIAHYGMRIQEGRATVSTDLAHALSWATTADKRVYSQSLTERAEHEVGRVFVISPPEHLKLGYGTFTSMKVDTTHGEIKGAPIKYASGRKQLAFYASDNTEVARERAEAEHTLGNDPKILDLSPENVLISLYPSDEVLDLVSQLQAKVKAFEQPDFDESARKLTQLITSDSRNFVVDGAPVGEIARTLVVSTIESIAISRVRNMSLDVKRALGFKIIKEDGSQDTKVVRIDHIKKRVLALYEKAHAADFRLGSSWLNGYLKDQSEKMMDDLGLIG